jgi:hypothetical protein
MQYFFDFLIELKNKKKCKKYFTCKYLIKKRNNSLFLKIKKYILHKKS